MYAIIKLIIKMHTVNDVSNNAAMNIDNKSCS